MNLKSFSITSCFFLFLATALARVIAASPGSKDLNPQIRRWEFMIFSYEKPNCEGDGWTEIRTSSGYTCSNLTESHSLRLAKQAGCKTTYYPDFSCQGEGSDIPELCKWRMTHTPDEFRTEGDCIEEEKYGCWGYEGEDSLIRSFSAECPAQRGQQQFMDQNQ